MRLLVFAHKLEAQTFIKSMKPTNHSNIFASDKDYLLITGQGINNIKIKLNNFLTEYSNITEIINLGIAGAIDSNLKLDQICSIGTFYRTNENLIQINNSPFSCLTVDSPLTTTSGILNISITDMEAWMIAKICNEQSIKFRAIKIISDYVGETVNIDQIKNRSLSFSEKLFKYL